MAKKEGLVILPSTTKDVLLHFQEPSQSWTDDLPECPFSGIGFSTNQKYKTNCLKSEEAIFEDRSFHFRNDEDTSLYGVFDGHNGHKAAYFAMQRIPAEILLDQLKDKTTDEEIGNTLKQAFLEVEEGYFDFIDDLLTEKENMKLELQDFNGLEALEWCPETAERFEAVTEEIKSGTTAIIALIRNNKLYLANVGDTRALLCKEVDETTFVIQQLNSVHTFDNKDEVLRMSKLGIDVQNMRDLKKMSLPNCTRCIGNYTVKEGYKEFDNFSESQDIPIIAEPEIIGGIEIDEKCKFLVLMSGGLHRSLEEAIGSDNINSVLVKIVLEQISEQSTIKDIAQAAVNKVVRLHHDAYLRDSKKCQKRDDMTLLIRNFNCPLRSSVPSSKQISSKDIRIMEEECVTNKCNTLSDNGAKNTWEYEVLVFMNDASLFADVTEKTESSSKLTLDEDGRITPYVDFSDYYTAVAEAHKKGFLLDDWLP